MLDKIIDKIIDKLNNIILKIKTRSTIKYSFSFDNILYSLELHDSLEKCIIGARKVINNKSVSREDNKKIESFWIGEFHLVSINEILNIHWLIEQMQETMDHEFEDGYEDWLDGMKDENEQDELEEHIAKWFRKKGYENAYRIKNQMKCNI